MYMYCPYKRAYILVYEHKELYTFAYVVPETVVFYTTTINYLKLVKMVKMLVKNYLKWW